MIAEERAGLGRAVARRIGTAVVIVAIGACGPGPSAGVEPHAPEDTVAGEGSTDAPVADVASVSASGEAQAYTFAVAIRSDETGCERYADWWEVVRPDGTLVYRRILTHSHPDEQPFERTGGPVPIDADEEVVVRAHLHPDGYGGAIMRGSVGAGFVAEPPDPGFAPDLESAAPQPEGCLF